MKYIIKAFVLAIMVVASCATVLAQRPTQKQRISREQLAETQAKYIANELAFSDDVTEKFVKTYCDYQKEIWALGPRRHHPNKRGLSEQESEEEIKQRFAISEKILDIRKKYYNEYSKFLTQKQITKVYEQENKMRNRFAKRGQKRLAHKQRK